MKKAAKKTVAAKRAGAKKPARRNPFRLLAHPEPPRVSFSTRAGAREAARHWLAEQPRAQFVEIIEIGKGRVAVVTRNPRRGKKAKKRNLPARGRAARGRKQKRNPAEAAKAMFERFHGKPSTKSQVHKVARHYHEHLAHLGELIELIVLLPDDSEVRLEAKGVNVASSEDGGQLYFLGGDQKINLSKLGLAATLPKDHVVIGPVLKIAYRSEKSFDGFKPLIYEHEFGEEGGELPTLLYDVRSQLMYLAGGSYQNLKPGIVD
jgi:hypothetical protein